MCYELWLPKVCLDGFFFFSVLFDPIATIFKNEKWYLMSIIWLKKKKRKKIYDSKGPFGSSILISQFSISITQFSKMVGPISILKKKVCLASHNSVFNFLFPSLNSLIFELWVMETENTFWLFSVFITNNSMAFL